MTKVLITGTSGTGKSTVLRGMSEHGYTCYDLDDTPGAVALEVRETGEVVDWPEGYVDWDHLAWNLQEKKLRELLGSADDVFVAIVASNQSRFYAWFDHIFVLTVDDETLRYRLEHRDAHQYGQTPKNINRIVSKNQTKIAGFVAEGAVPIDNTARVSMVVDKILELSDVSKFMAQ